VKIGTDVRFDEVTFRNDVSCKSKPIFGFEKVDTGINDRSSSFLPGLGDTESLPCEQFEGAKDNEATAYAVQGLVLRGAGLGGLIFES
jgi:hypothetical protein